MKKEIQVKRFLMLLILIGFIGAACSRKPDLNSASIVEDDIEYNFDIPTPAPYPEQNFAIKFEFGSCNRDILDTFTGTFTKDMIVDTAITIPFEISDSQKIAIYLKMLEIDFFDYPEVFAIQTSPDDVVGIVTPAMKYRITVHNGDLTKTLYWVDEIVEPTTPEAENLRSLFGLIIKIAQNNPEYQQLPQPKAGCV